MNNNSSEIEAVILAGGYGTRLRTILGDIPKPMAPVRNKPFLEYILNWLSAYNVTSIVMSVGYKAEAIVTFFGNEYRSLPITYVYESEPLGTGGGILNALKNIAGSDFLALNGDTYFPVDIKSFVSHHRKGSGQVTVALKNMDSSDRFGSVDIDDDQNIISFNEKTSKGTGLVNGGLYVINRDFLENSAFPSRCSFEKDILEKSAGTGRIKGMIFNTSFLDIGVPDDYYKAEFII